MKEQNEFNIDEIANQTNLGESNVLSLFAAAVAGYILGKNVSVKVRGKKSAIESLQKALKHSRQLFEIVQNRHQVDDDTYLHVKQRADKYIQRFEELTNIEWPV